MSLPPSSLRVWAHNAIGIASVRERKRVIAGASKVNNSNTARTAVHFDDVTDGDAICQFDTREQGMLCRDVLYRVFGQARFLKYVSAKSGAKRSEVVVGSPPGRNARNRCMTPDGRWQGRA